MTLAALRRRIRGRDRLAICAIAIALGALAFEVVAVLPLEAKVRRQRAAVHAVVPAAAPAAQSGPRAQLTEFYSLLPPATEARDMVRRLHMHAGEAGLQLRSGEYRPPPPASSTLLRYQIVLPVTGTYQQVRRFLAAAMQDMPNLALDGIDFRRESGKPPRIEAQLRLTAFLRAGA